MTLDTVPFLELTRFDETIVGEATEAFQRFFTSGQYILGGEVSGFEKACAEALGTKHALGVSSGTDALILALMSLGIGQGDEVVCPTFTFFATAGAIHRVGATPVFADIELSDFNSSAEQIARHITPSTKAIMPVHLFGQCADQDKLRKLAKDNDVALIEDAAQAFGAHPGVAANGAGAVGDYGCFSFFPSKNLGGFGDAGLVTTQDDTLAEKARIMRTHGGKPKYYHSVVGGNFRMDPIQAILLGLRLKRLDAATAGRIANAEAYTARFRDAGIGAPNEGQKDVDLAWPTVVRGHHIFNQYTLRVGKGRRDALREHLDAKGVGSQIYYPVPMHLQPCFRYLEHKKGDFPNSERGADEAISLPIFPELTPDEINYAADQVIAFFK